jgi:hypothetical protein
MRQNCVFFYTGRWKMPQNTTIILLYRPHKLLHLILLLFCVEACNREHIGQPSKSKRANAGSCNADLMPSVFSKCTWQLLTYLRCSAVRVVWMFAIRYFLSCSVSRAENLPPFQAEYRFKQQHSTKCNIYIYRGGGTVV